MKFKNWSWTTVAEVTVAIVAAGLVIGIISRIGR